MGEVLARWSRTAVLATGLRTLHRQQLPIEQRDLEEGQGGAEDETQPVAKLCLGKYANACEVDGTGSNLYTAGLTKGTSSIAAGPAFNEQAPMIWTGRSSKTRRTRKSTTR
jgi:hypothetical protein